MKEGAKRRKFKQELKRSWKEEGRVMGKQW
jgi:hypothetical protein